MRLFLIGYMGAGKTTIGRIVAERLNLNFVDMDTHIEQRQFKTVSQIFSEFGEEKFRILEKKCLLEVSQYEDTVISTGGGVPCFFDNMALMNRVGETIYIKQSPADLCERLNAPNIHKRPVLANRGGEELEEFIAANLEKRELFYKQAKITVSGTDEEIIDKIVGRFSAK